MQQGSILPPPNSSSLGSLALSAWLHHTKQEAQKNPSVLFPCHILSAGPHLPLPSHSCRYSADLITSLLISSARSMLTAPKSFTLLQKQSCHSILIMSGRCFDSFQNFPLPSGQSPSSLECLLGSTVGQTSDSLSPFGSLLTPNTSAFPGCLAFAAWQPLCGIPESGAPLPRRIWYPVKLRTLFFEPPDVHTNTHNARQHLGFSDSSRTAVLETETAFRLTLLPYSPPQRPAPRQSPSLKS